MSLWCIAFYWPIDLLAQQPSFEIVLLQHYHRSASSRCPYKRSKAFVIWRPLPWQNRVLPCISQHHKSKYPTSAALSLPSSIHLHKNYVPSKRSDTYQTPCLAFPIHSSHGLSKCKCTSISTLTPTTPYKPITDTIHTYLMTLPRSQYPRPRT